MKVGDKVICIKIEDSQDVPYIPVIGKIYEVCSLFTHPVNFRTYIRLENNQIYISDLFITLEENRDNKLNNLLYKVWC
jgi:hypothetical protein